jgi:hypothetical protein
MGGYPAMVRGEPGYEDQVVRRLAYEATHPDTEIIYCGPHWKAVIHEDGDGSTEINRLSLRSLLDKLESLGADDDLSRRLGLRLAGHPALASRAGARAGTLLIPPGTCARPPPYRLSGIRQKASSAASSPLKTSVSTGESPFCQNVHCDHGSGTSGRWTS